MNYPIWDLPASGLLIAAVAVLHVFISHFAVGGGLFLVVSERKARREQDALLLGYVRRFSRFFILLTLVLGAVTGVGIWFTIGLVHPAATALLINTFVWAWAIEWTFFLAEIVAAMVYYYGWDRLSPRAHVAVGWVYFANAWLSLIAINGILAFMLTPGSWVTTRAFWDGFFNPTYWPALAARSFAAAGLAGLYALVVASWSTDRELKARIGGYAGLYWVLPMAVAIPASLFWYLSAAAGAGVPVTDILGALDGGLLTVVQSVLAGSTSGQPVTQRAVLVTLVGAIIIVVATSYAVWLRRGSYGRPVAAVLVLAGLATIGGAEWTREGLRKPYVIGHVMFVNGVRLPPPPSVAAPPADFVAKFGEDRFTVTALNRNGVLASAQWARAVPSELPAADAAAQSAGRGEEVFRILCRRCHTTDSYLAIRPLVAGKSVTALDALLDRLARPVDAAGQPAGWDTPGLRLATWRNRRMPPFTGTAGERRDLSVYLAVLGGTPATSVAAPSAGDQDIGRQVFDQGCSACHADDAQWPMRERVRKRAAGEFYGLIGNLPAINAIMPAFEGTDAERRAVASYIASLGAAQEGRQ